MIARGSPTRRRAAAAVEVALVLPVFLTMFLGVLEFARLGMAIQMLNTAAREGCRVGALPGYAAADVTARVAAVLGGSGFPTPTSTLSPTDPTTAAGGTPITLTLTMPFSSVSWLRTATFMNLTVRASASFTSERP